MKKILLAFMFFVFPHISFAQDFMQPHIEVFGKSTIKVKPNTMTWHLNITTIADDLDAASQGHSDTLKNVLQIIRSKNVEQSSVQTSRMSFNEHRVYKTHMWIKEGYVAKTSVKFKLTDFNDYEDLWFTLSKVKGVAIDNVSYDHSDRIGFRNKARKEALLVARKKAEVMAETLGVKVGKPIAISEIQYSTYAPNMNSNMVSLQASGSAGNSSISLGTIPISMKVKLVMGIITK